MTKYYENSNNTSSRYERNTELYKEISKSEIEGFSVKSNATVIGENKREIDIEKIKSILDTKYNEAPKRRSIRIEEPEEIKQEKEVTKEYDINVILEKAKEQKEDNYDEERLKKLHDTQYDILNNLSVNEESDEEDDDLKKLINTITMKEKENSSDDSPLDILSDLKGDDNTEVLEGLKEEIKATDNKEDIVEKEDEDQKLDLTDTKIINSFYTTTNALNDEDFEDLDDFSKSIESNNVLTKVVIALVVIVLLIGIALIIKTIYFS
jgi:hypothetical protein